jgi:hypothetical protein
MGRVGVIHLPTNRPSGLAWGWLSLLVGFFSLLVPAICACPLKLPHATVIVGGHPLVVEVAATPQSRACGLSQRLGLADNHGMLFVYPQAEPRTFWMKDTYIPLSIAFVDASKIIINIERMAPNQTTQRYFSRRPAIYAIEANRGWFVSRGIRAGDKISIQWSPTFD